MAAPSTEGHINQTGITVVWDSPDSALDVVFVHGLDGHPYETWTASGSKDVFWPRDLLPETLKSHPARILTYGYEATIFSLTDDGAEDGLLQHGEALAYELTINRKLKNCIRKPLVFVCHSLGGLIVKAALLACAKAMSNGHMRALYVSTHGVIFLTTPHFGPATTALRGGTILQSIVNLTSRSLTLNSARDLASTLQARSKTLERLDEEFKEHLQNLQAACFYETRPTALLGTKKLIVDVISAVPPYVISQCDVAGIPANHQDICRFSSASDPGYDQVTNTILKFSEDSMDFVPAKWKVFFHHNAGPEFEEGEPKPVDSPTLMSNTLLFFGPLDPYSKRTLFGRADELAELRQHLLGTEGRPRATSSVLIYGDAGFGKSRLARQFIYQSSQAYTTGVFWINARSILTCKESYLALAEELLENDHAQLSYVDSKEPDGLINMARSWLESKDDWLMVFDGIAFGDRSLRAFKQLLPMSRRSSIIYTSCDQSLCKKTTLFEPLGINAGPLDRDSAVCMLYHELHIDNPTKDQNSKADKLVDRYNCQPLAIRTASCLLKTCGISLDDFDIPSESSPSIDELYRRLYEKLQDQPEPLMLMNILSFFENRVPLQMIHLGAPFLARFTHKLEAEHREKNTTSNAMAQAIDALVQHGLAESSYSTYISQTGQDVFQDQLDDTSSADLQPLEKGGSSGRVDYLEVFPTAQSYFRARLSEKKGESEWWLGLAAMMLIYTYRTAFHDQQGEKTLKPYVRPIRDLRQFRDQTRRLVEHSNCASTDISKTLEKLLKGFLDSIDREIKKREEAEIAAAMSLDADNTANKVMRSVFYIGEGDVTGLIQGDEVARDILDIHWPEEPTDMALVAPPEALKTLASAFSDPKDEQAPPLKPEPEKASQQSNLNESEATDTTNAQTKEKSPESPPRRDPTPPQPSPDIPDNLIEWSDEEDEARLPAFQLVGGKKKHKAPGPATEEKDEDSPGAKTAADGKSKPKVRVQSGEKGERRPPKWSKSTGSVASRKPITKDEPKTTSGVRWADLASARKQNVGDDGQQRDGLAGMHQSRQSQSRQSQSRQSQSYQSQSHQSQSRQSQSRQSSGSSWARIASTATTTSATSDVPAPTASGPAPTTIKANTNKPPTNVDDGSEQVEAQERSLLSATIDTSLHKRELDVQAVNESIDHRRKLAWSNSTEDDHEFPPLGSKPKSEPLGSESESKPLGSESESKPLGSESESKPLGKDFESNNGSESKESVWKVPTKSTGAPTADEAEFPSLGSQPKPKNVPGSATPTEEYIDNAAGDSKTDIPPAGDAAQHKKVSVFKLPGNKSTSRITTYAKADFPPLVSEVDTKAKNKIVLRPRDSASSESTSAWSAGKPRGQDESVASKQPQPLNKWVDVLKNDPKAPKDEASLQTTAQQTETPPKSWADALKTDNAPAQRTPYEANVPSGSSQDRKAPLQTQPSRSWADALKTGYTLSEIIAQEEALASAKRKASGPPPENRVDALKKDVSNLEEDNNQLATREVPEQSGAGLFQSMNFSTSGNWADMMDEEEEFFSNKEAPRVDEQDVHQQERLALSPAGIAKDGDVKVRENDAPLTHAKPPSKPGNNVHDTPPDQTSALHETSAEQKNDDLANPKKDLPTHAVEVTKPLTSAEPETRRQTSTSWADMMDEEEEFVIPPQPPTSKDDTRDQQPPGERIDSAPSQSWPGKPNPSSHDSSPNPEDKFDLPWRPRTPAAETSVTHKPTKPATTEKSPPQQTSPSKEQSPRRTGDAEQALQQPPHQAEANVEQSSQQIEGAEKTTSPAKVTKGPIARLLAEDQTVQSRDSSSDRTGTTTAMTPPTPITEPDATPEKNKSPHAQAPKPKSGLSKQMSAGPGTGTRGPMPGFGRGMFMRHEGEVSTLDLSDGRQVSGEMTPKSEQETPHREAPSTEQAKGEESQESRQDAPDSQGPENQQQSASQLAEDAADLKGRFLKFLESGKEPALPTNATCQVGKTAEANVLPQAPFATPEHSNNPVLATGTVTQKDNQVIDADLASRVPPFSTPGRGEQGPAPNIAPVEQSEPQNAEGVNPDKSEEREGDSKIPPSKPEKAAPILRLVLPPAAETDEKAHEAGPQTDQQPPGKPSNKFPVTRGPSGSEQRANPPNRYFLKGAGRGSMQPRKPTHEPHGTKPAQLGGPRQLREPSHRTDRPQIPQPNVHLHSATPQQRIIPRTLTCTELEQGNRPPTQQEGNRQRQDQLTATAQQAPDPVDSRPAGEPVIVSSDLWVRGLLTGDHSINRDDEGLKKKKKEKHHEPSTTDQACQTEPILSERTTGPAIEHVKKTEKGKHQEPSTKDQMCQTEPILLEKAKGPAIEHKDKKLKRERESATYSPERFRVSISSVEYSEASSGFERFHTPEEYPESTASADGPFIASAGKGIGMSATREGKVRSKLPTRTIPKERSSSPHSTYQEPGSSPDIVEKLRKAVVAPRPHDSFEPGPSAIGQGGAPTNFNEAVAFLDKEAQGRKRRKTSRPNSSVAVAATTPLDEQPEEIANSEPNSDMKSSRREMIQMWIDRIKSPKRYIPEFGESEESSGPTPEEGEISPLSGFKSGEAVTGFSQPQTSGAPTLPRNQSPTLLQRPVIGPSQPLPPPAIHTTGDGQYYMMVAVPVTEPPAADRGFVLPGPMLPGPMLPMTPSRMINQPPARGYGGQGPDHPYMYRPMLQRPDLHPIVPWPDQSAPMRVTHTPPQYEAHPPPMHNPWVVQQPQPEHPRKSSGKEKPHHNRNKTRRSRNNKR